MKWTSLHGRGGDEVIAMSDLDLKKAAPIFAEAAAMWERDGTNADRTSGSVVIGSGIGVLYLPPRCRKPREHIVIPSPFQSDGGGSIRHPLNYLARHGIAAFHVYGRMD